MRLRMKQNSIVKLKDAVKLSCGFTTIRNTLSSAQVIQCLHKIYICYSCFNYFCTSSNTLAL